MEQVDKFQSIFSLTNFHYSRPSNKIYMLRILCTLRFFFVLVYIGLCPSFHDNKLLDTYNIETLTS